MKPGAIVGAFGFLFAAQSSKDGNHNKGYHAGIELKNSFLLLSIINAAGFLCTFLVPETKGKSLEDLSGENIDVETPRQGQDATGAPYSFERLYVTDSRLEYQYKLVQLARKPLESLLS